MPDGGVVLHTVTKRYYSLNETGAHIWTLLFELGDPALVASRLASEYSVARTDAEHAVAELVAELLSAGLLHETEG